MLMLLMQSVLLVAAIGLVVAWLAVVVTLVHDEVVGAPESRPAPQPMRFERSLVLRPQRGFVA